MTKRSVYHVTKDKNGWKAKLEGGERASARDDMKSDVVERAIELAKNAPLGQVIVHKEDGTIQTEYTYGKDPERRKG